MISITEVRFEHHHGPAIGIDEASPRISWSFDGDDFDWTQRSYELEIQRENDSVEKFTVNSAECRLVAWPSRPLASRESAQVRVRATGLNSGAVTGWSEPETVEAGLLNSSGWKASLIEPDTSYTPGPPHRPVIFRRSIHLEQPIKSARLYLTAHGVYEARINGQQAGDQVLAPGWTSYSHRLVYQTYDVATLLTPGENIIDVDVAEGWYCGRLGFLGGRNNIYGNSIGLFGMLVVNLADGHTVICGTDDQWKWAYSSTVSSELYDGEHFDARNCISAQTKWENTISKQPPAGLVAPDGPPVRRTQEIRPPKIIQSPSGKTVIDFGQNFVGWTKVNVSGPSGTTISLQFAEVLENGEVATRPLRAAKCTDSITLSDQPLVWEPKFTFHGFRYMEVIGWPGKPQLQDFTGVVVNTDMKRTGFFKCSNPLLNKLHENVTWSMRGNFLSIPTDCPQRDERLGWTGDINVFADTANYLFDTTGMLSSWLKDLSFEQQRQDGIVPLVVPDVIQHIMGKDAQAIWGDVAIMLPWSLYQSSGDKSFLARQYTSMKSWLSSIPRKPDTNLWNYPSGMILGDWLDPAAPPENPGAALTDPVLVSDAFLVHVTTLMSQIASVLSLDEDASHYTALAAQLRTSFANEYITPSGRVACDTQTALALAIQFSLFPTPAQQATAASRLSTLVLRNSRFKIATGFAGTPYVGHALSTVGQSNLFYRMLLHRKNPSWLYPVTMGATTVWERWDSMLADGSINPGEMTSFNHYALGAVASWMHGVIVGLKPSSSGWKTFDVAPVPGGGLKWAEGEYTSCYGVCRVRWEIRGSSKRTTTTTTTTADSGQEEALVFWLKVTVPPNTSARIILPGQSKSQGQQTETLVVGSGTREWEVPYEAPEWPPKADIPKFAPRDDDLPEDEVLPY